MWKILSDGLDVGWIQVWFDLKALFCSRKVFKNRRRCVFGSLMYAG